MSEYKEYTVRVREDRTEWRVGRNLHRENGPAREWRDGLKEWFLGGKRHREDGPAVVWADGTKEWWINGNLHRLDGPARKWQHGGKEWWIHGLRLSEDEFKRRTSSAPCDGKVVEIDGKRYRLIAE